MELVRNDSVVFEPFTHSYLCGDNVLKGVTTLMKEHGLAADYEGIKEDVLARAAARGTAIHSMLEDYDNGKAVVTSDVLSDDGTVVCKAATMGKILKSYSDLGLRVAASEYLVSDNELVASSIDKVLETDSPDEVELADVKTTSTLHRDALAVQLGIYKVLFEMQNPGLRVRSCYGIHIDTKSGKARKVDVEPWSEENVKALFEAEREGRVYETSRKSPRWHLSSVLAGVNVPAYIGALENIQALRKALKSAEDFCRGYDARIAEWMEANGVTELEAGTGRITLVHSSERAVLDTTKLREENPEIYEKYKRLTPVKASIKFKY